MTSQFLALILMIAALVIPAVANDTLQQQLTGTWSGGWVPENGTHDSMTIELRYDDRGTLQGRFVTPVAVDFTKATFNAKTKMLSAEALNSGKKYALSATLDGTEIRGTLNYDNQAGAIHLIKWTFQPPLGRYGR